MEDREGRLDDLLRAWARDWTAGGLFGEIEHRREPDPRGDYHWLVRVRGEEKDVITLWWRLGKRRVHVECEVTPAPEENAEALFRFLLTRNATLAPLHAGIGPEEGIYLVGSFDLEEVTLTRIDEIVASTVTAIDEIYPTAMTMAHPRWYRRRPPRPAR